MAGPRSITRCSCAPAACAAACRRTSRWGGLFDDGFLLISAQCQERRQLRQAGARGRTAAVPPGDAAHQRGPRVEDGQTAWAAQVGVGCWPPPRTPSRPPKWPRCRRHVAHGLELRQPGGLARPGLGRDRGAAGARCRCAGGTVRPRPWAARRSRCVCPGGRLRSAHAHLGDRFLGRLFRDGGTDAGRIAGGLPAIPRACGLDGGVVVAGVGAVRGGFPGRVADSPIRMPKPACWPMWPSWLRPCWG